MAQIGHVAATLFLFTSSFVFNGFRLHIGLTVPRQDRVAWALESCWSFAHSRTLIDRSCCPKLPPVAVVVCHMPCYVATPSWAVQRLRMVNRRGGEGVHNWCLNC
ncbi:hypothetical protein B0T13DRAFT_476910 [Neurospora crassa]|nr:hypothetical protein B0T13DRAFT_476910 [Neurospora crassa]